MDMNLYIVDYESSRWCGGQSYAVVMAENVEDAEACPELETHMEETMREMFSGEDDADGTDDDDVSYFINSVEEFLPGHEAWKWFMDEKQREAFYPCVNFEFRKLRLGV